jgi:hypothetical protein
MAEGGARRLVLEESIDIAASPAVVWEVFQDLPSWPQWNRVCINANWTSRAPWQRGAAFRMWLRMARIPVPFNVRLDEVAPPQTVAWVSTAATVTGHRRFRFTPIGTSGWTRVEDIKTFTSPILPLRLFYPRPIIQAMSRGWLRSLKREAERVAAERRSQPSS